MPYVAMALVPAVPLHGLPLMSVIVSLQPVSSASSRCPAPVCLPSPALCSHRQGPKPWGRTLLLLGGLPVLVCVCPSAPRWVLSFSNERPELRALWLYVESRDIASIKHEVW